MTDCTPPGFPGMGQVNVTELVDERNSLRAEIAKYRGMEVELAALKNEREELAIAFHALEPAAHDGRLIALYGLPSHESYKTFARIFRVE